MSSYDSKILSLYISFGFLIILGYGLLIKKYSKNKSLEIWNNKNKNMILKYKSIKYAYYINILLSFIAGSYLIYYLTTIQKGHIDEILIYVGSIMFLVCSTVWAFFPFENSIIILGMVAIGAILILSGICVNNENDSKKIIALCAISIIVLQTSLFDFGIWTGLLKF